MNYPVDPLILPLAGVSTLPFKTTEVVMSFERQ